VRAEGGQFAAGRTKGYAWMTEPMRERALAEARRLGATRFMLDRLIIPALSGSENGSPQWEARAKALLAASMRAAMAVDIKKVEQIIRELLPNIDDRFRSLRRSGVGRRGLQRSGREPGRSRWRITP
jgi:hypothetical protein